MVSKLNDYDLARDEKYAGVTLTDEGHAIVRELAWRLCVVTNFFERELVADLDDDRSYEIGYALPVETIDPMSDLVNHPRIDHCPQTRQDYEG